MTYAEMLARLLPARRFGVVLGTERMRALLDRLGAPDRRLGAVVHVGGTNGKGSTVAMIAALATAAGKRVATYTSPHLSSLRERVTIAGAMIDEATMAAAAERVAAAGGDELTFFEQVTAIAMIAIADAAVDVTVLEVGLGGRLDATNVVDAPVAVVTGVAMDHEAILGSTLPAIAAEKAGIFKRGQRIVTVIDDAAIAAVPPVALAGAHQRRNAAAALAAIDQLEALGVLACPPALRAHALASVKHPGRFERIGDVILDGAHNPHGAAALAAALPPGATLVLAVSADKDVAGIVAALEPVVARAIATRYQQDRAMEPAALAAYVTRVPVETAPDLATALAAARRAGGPIVVAGSLFLVGEARVLLLGAPADPMWVSDPPARP